MKILYICTHNRCRSILSEALTNHLTEGKIIAKSAGSSPSGEVHPLSIEFLKQASIPTNGLKSQSWDELEDFHPDVVITVCDSAAQEACPVWFGNSVVLHWGLADPSKVEGSETEKATAFQRCIAEITERVKKLQTIAEQNLDQAELATVLKSLT